MSATTTYALDLGPPAPAYAKQVHEKVLPTWVRLVREIDPAHSEPVHIRNPQDVHRLLHVRATQELSEVFYLITLKSSEQDGLTGMKGSMLRRVAVDKTRSWAFRPAR